MSGVGGGGRPGNPAFRPAPDAPGPNAMTDAATMQTPWALGPFSPPVRVLDERPEVTFACPVSGRTVAWAAKDAFNPGAVVHDGRVCLLVRAEDDVGRYAGVSRIGLATSSDGRTFTLEPEPVI